MAAATILHRVVLADVGQPLFAALAAAIPGLSRHQARQAVMGGLVTVEGMAVSRPTEPLARRASVEVDLRHGIRRPFVARIHEAPGPDQRPFTILHQDHALVVVDKAAGVLSAPSSRGERGHVPELLRRALQRREQAAKYLGVVHRLDKETSGCLVVALTRTAHSDLAKQFSEHTARRSYRCLVLGAPRKDEDTLEGSIAHGRYGRRVLLQGDEQEEKPGKAAVTRFRVVTRGERVSELEVALETGRTHQIRVSLAAIGCPVVGDRVYGFREPDRRSAASRPLPGPPRLMLHAHRLEFLHPGTGQPLAVSAPVPEVFAQYQRLAAKA
jgi:23S rRNA pseudouridine1911/1915/1917 synthase